MSGWIVSANRGAEVIVRWASLVAIMIGAYTWLATKLSWFAQLSIFEQIAIAIPATLVTLLALSGSAALYRYFRPLPSPSGGRAGEEQENMSELEKRLARLEHNHGNLRDKYIEAEQAGGLSPYDDRGLEHRISALEGQLTKIIEDYQHMRRLENTVSTEDAAIRAEVQALEQKFDELRERTRGSIHALLMREQIAEISRGVREDASELSRHVSNGQEHDKQSWDRWQNVHSHWLGLLAQWWNGARFYLPNSGRVLQAPDHLYSQTLVDESLLIPAGGAEAVRVYKRFRIVQDQWEAVQEQLDHNMNLVAFHGMKEQDVRNGQPLEQG
jgi:hypothetical protein